MLELILGSSSPSRRALLERLRLPFSIDVSHVDEMPLEGELPNQTALRLAEAKARAVAERHPYALVIGADQVLMLDGKQFGKPMSRENAIRYLEMLQGRTATFHSAMCLLNTQSNHLQIDEVITEVTFRSLTRAQLERYVDLDDPIEVAGAAKAESLGIALIERMESVDPTAIIGLPLIRLTTMLANEGIQVL